MQAAAAAGLAELGTCILGRVDWAFALVWSKCPFNIAIDSGKWARTCFDVSSGHVVRCCASIALHQVEMVGENRLA
eukprot:scaffold22287_cov37-Attheya_sp.AAC.1